MQAQINLTCNYNSKLFPQIDKTAMEGLMNKKNLNRISHRCPKLLQHQGKQSNQPISTFCRINDRNANILSCFGNEEEYPTKIQNILSFCRHVSRKRNRFVDLSKPRGTSRPKNYEEENNRSLRQNHLHPQGIHSRNKFEPNHTSHLNKTISFSFSNTTTARLSSKPKSAYQQDEIDLKNQEFKRRQQSLKIYQTSSAEQKSGAQKNTIISNSIGKLSTAEILKIKKKEEQQRQLIRLLANGQMVSIEPCESQERRQLGIFKLNVKQSHEPMLQQISLYHDNLDKKTLEKYKILLNSIQDSEAKYPIQSYDDYDKALTQRYSTSRARKAQRNKLLLNCGEGWR